MRHFFYLMPAILLFMITAPLQSNAQSFLAQDGGYVEFVSTAPLLEFKGKSNNLAGLINFEENTVDFYIDLNTLDTGVRLRNQHMRDSYLETEKYPFAEFTGTLDTMYDFEKAGPQEVTTTGVFNIHGVEQERTIRGVLEYTGEGLKLEASWTVLLEDHNIRKPRVVFYELADEQTVNISIVLLKQED